jgi:hypothetical protein
MCLFVFFYHRVSIGKEEMMALLADTDAVVKEYKETHEGWL